MSYHSTYIQIKDMRFSAHVSLIEFQKWLDEVEVFLKAKQNFVLVMKTERETTFPEEYRQVQASWYKKNKKKIKKY